MKNTCLDEEKIEENQRENRREREGREKKQRGNIGPKKSLYGSFQKNLKYLGRASTIGWNGMLQT